MKENQVIVNVSDDQIYVRSSNKDMSGVFSNGIFKADGRGYYFNNSIGEVVEVRDAVIRHLVEEEPDDPVIIGSDLIGFPIDCIESFLKGKHINDVYLSDYDVVDEGMRVKLNGLDAIIDDNNIFLYFTCH